MATEIYIGTERADFSGDVSVVFSGGYLRDITEGQVASSYEIKLPLTDKNKRLLKYSNEFNVLTEITDIGRIERNNLTIMKGKIIILSLIRNVSVTIIIQGSFWMDHFKGLSMRTLDLTSYNHTFNATNVEGSWTGTARSYRYPMINFGRLISHETGDHANWHINDFVPMWRLVDLLNLILYPWTLAGTWLTTIAEHYVLGTEQKYPSEDILNRNMGVRPTNNAENAESLSIANGITDTWALYKSPVSFNTAIVNDGLAWSAVNDVYTVPKTGTYRFTFAPICSLTTSAGSGWEVTDVQYTVTICKYSGSTETELVTQTETSGDDIINGYTYAIDTGYIHLIAGETIYARLDINVTVYNYSGGALTFTLALVAGTVAMLSSVVDEHCLYAGIGKTIEGENYMPDITRLDFVRGIKEAYGLKFTPDILRQTVYVEPMDDCFTQNLKTITHVDYSSIETDFISSNYKKTQEFKFSLDESDTSVREYMKGGIEPRGTIILTSSYADPAVETHTNNVFAWSAMGAVTQIGLVTPAIVRIWGEIDETLKYPLYRAIGWKPRLMIWDGLTSGFTWYLDGIAKTTYPKITPVSMGSNVTSNLLKMFHYIDRGKLIKLHAVVNERMLQEFVTVISNINEEGFRAMYEFEMNGQKYYGYLNKIEFTGNKALMELIIKH